MTAEKHDRDRADRDKERLKEAHWQIAEAGAQKHVRTAAKENHEEQAQHDWDNEGGALGGEKE